MNLIKGINHITLAVTDIHRSFSFYKDILGFKPLCKSDGSAYFLVGNPDDPGCLWFSLDLDRSSLRRSSPCNTHFAFSVNDEDFEALCQRITQSGAKVFKDNTSPGKSLYFLDPDDHKLEIHVGDWQARIAAKKFTNLTDLSKTLKQSGLEILENYGDFMKAPFDSLKSKDIILICKRAL